MACWTSGGFRSKFSKLSCVPGQPYSPRCAFDSCDWLKSSTSDVELHLSNATHFNGCCQLVKQNSLKMPKLSSSDALEAQTEFGSAADDPAMASTQHPLNASRTCSFHLPSSRERKQDPYLTAIISLSLSQHLLPRRRSVRGQRTAFLISFPEASYRI